MTTTTTDPATVVDVFGGTITVSDQGVHITRDGLSEHLDAIDTVKLLDALRDREVELRAAAREHARLIAWENAAEVAIQLTRKNITIRSITPAWTGDGVFIALADPTDFHKATEGRDVHATDYDTFTGYEAVVADGVTLTVREHKQ